MDSTSGELENVVFQVLASRERREILRIIHSTEKGATYTEVLGELGLTTGNLNYHLKQLEGLIQRDGDRRISLTSLGEKAYSVLSASASDRGYGEFLNAEAKGKVSPPANDLHVVAYRAGGISFSLELGDEVHQAPLEALTVLLDLLGEVLETHVQYS